jgi:TonB family protein
MRRSLFIAIVVLSNLAATQLFADVLKPFSVEMRSARYLLSVGVAPAGDGENRYTLTVTDLASSQVFNLPAVVLRSAIPGESTLDANGSHFLVAVTQVGTSLTGLLTVTDTHGAVVDSLRGSWGPREDPLAAAYPHAYRVGRDVKAPMVVHRVEPVYSEDARKARISGIVIAEAMIDETGVVRDVRILKGLPSGLSEASADALRQWTFKPGTLNGQPVPVLFNLTVNFKLGIPVPAPERRPE